MKSIKTYFSSLDSEGGRHDIRESRSSPVDVDLSTLCEHYEALGEKHLKALLKFKDYWENEGENLLFTPFARIVTMRRSHFCDIFGEEILENDKDTCDVAVAVWTLGSALEKQSSLLMSSRGDLMTGFLLDVAGSIALYKMHDAVMEWIKKEVTEPCGKFIATEYYPGFESVGQNMMEKIVSVTDASDIIGVLAHSSSLLYPRKTQCSLVGISTEDIKCVIKATPCSPCNGKKCLYYQLGGCHMQVMGTLK